MREITFSFVNIAYTNTSLLQQLNKNNTMKAPNANIRNNSDGTTLNIVMAGETVEFSATSVPSFSEASPCVQLAALEGFAKRLRDVSARSTPETVKEAVQAAITKLQAGEYPSTRGGQPSHAISLKVTVYMVKHGHDVKSAEARKKANADWKALGADKASRKEAQDAFFEDPVNSRVLEQLTNKKRLQDLQERQRVMAAEDDQRAESGEETVAEVATDAANYYDTPA